jgi:hypothetical protein
MLSTSSARGLMSPLNAALRSHGTTMQILITFAPGEISISRHLHWKTLAFAYITYCELPLKTFQRPMLWLAKVMFVTSTVVVEFEFQDLVAAAIAAIHDCPWGSLDPHEQSSACPVFGVPSPLR